MSQTIPGKTITIDQLKAMFENISEKTDWDLSGEMLWGYFFTHREPKALEPIFQSFWQRECHQDAAGRAS